VAKRTTGVVRWFDGSKGYGYIDAKDGEQVFVHYSASPTTMRRFSWKGNKSSSSSIKPRTDHRQLTFHVTIKTFPRSWIIRAPVG